ncbi:hypothetical protein LJR235_004592 [Pararhizobium sp. LjRoot235]|uniref:hypothetical protein n=1 Tax=Pararhizobium sp. LjRoot235 TaxID=3342291 RepID=UPI003ECEC37B
MNTLLAEGGFSWTVVPFDRRDDYMSALNAASSKVDIYPLAAFLAHWSALRQAYTDRLAKMEMMAPNGRKIVEGCTSSTTELIISIPPPTKLSCLRPFDNDRLLPDRWRWL